MKKLSFPTVKLGNFICEVKEKVKDLDETQIKEVISNLYKKLRHFSR